MREVERLGEPGWIVSSGDSFLTAEGDYRMHFSTAFGQMADVYRLQTQLLIDPGHGLMLQTVTLR